MARLFRGSARASRAAVDASSTAPERASAPHSDARGRASGTREGACAPRELRTALCKFARVPSFNAFAIAAMCSGVLPQQPPAMLIKLPRRKFTKGNCPCPRASNQNPLATMDSVIRRSDNRKLPCWISPRVRRGTVSSSLGERAVEADGDWLHMLHRVPIRLDGLRGNHRLAHRVRRLRKS